MLLCKECNSKEKAPGRSRCWSCYGKYRRGEPRPCAISETPMKVLFIDIETSPDIVYTWGYFKTNIGIEQVIQTGDMLCFAAKWFHEDEIQFYSIRNDNYLNMIKKARDLLDEADVVVHYWGSEFDVKWINRVCLENGLYPPSPFKQIDLKKVVSQNFHYPSKKLQFITKQLGLEGKLEHEGFRLWLGVMEDDDESWAKFEAYNRQDVNLLLEVYEIVLPWIDHPHRWLYGEHEGCPSCGFENLVSAGFAYTRVSKYNQYRCTNCGSFFRSSRRIEGVSLQASIR